MPGEPITRRLLLSQLAAWGLAAAQEHSGAPDPLAGLRTEHPRLILPDSELGRIRALTRDNPLAHKLLVSLQHDAERVRTGPAMDYKLINQRLPNQSRHLLERVYAFALLYRLDNDQAHLLGAMRDLRAAALFPNWNPQHFPTLAAITHAFAIGYDWLHPALAEADRDWMRQALIEKGLQPALAAYRDRADWVRDDTTANLVCNSGASIGALSIAHEEPDLARQVLNNAWESVRHGLASFAPDGGWAEGPAFWNYGTRSIVHLLAALESAVDDDGGLSRSRGLDRTGRFRVYFTGPTGKTFNFGDSGDDPGLAPEMFWLARRFNQPVYAWQELVQLERGNRADPLDLVWFYKDGKRPQSDDWPLCAIFNGVQAAFLRTAWDDPNAIFLATKGGDNGNTHAHLDLGTFVLDAGGVRWVYDPETDPNTEVHNLLLIDGENQSRKAEASITRHEFGPELSWVQIDGTAAYAGKLRQWQRKVGIAQKQAVLIQDTIASDQPVEPLWGMVTEADISIKGQSAELRKADWILACEIRSPHHAVFDVVERPGTKKLVVRVGTKVNALDLNVMLTPYRSGQPKPVIAKQFPA